MNAFITIILLIYVIVEIIHGTYEPPHDCLDCVHFTTSNHGLCNECSDWEYFERIEEQE